MTEANMSPLQEIRRLQKEDKFPFVPIEEVKLSPKETKEDRIRSLQGLFSVGMITIPKELRFFSTYHKEMQDFVQAFLYEFYQFPMCEHDDILDTLSQITKFTVVKGTLHKKDVEYKGETFMEAINKIRMAKSIMTQDPYVSYEEATELVR